MKNFNDISNIFLNIECSKGINAKKLIIKNALSNDNLSKDFEQILFHLFSPTIITGISKTSWLKVNETGTFDFKTINDLLDYLHKNNSGKLETIKTLKAFAITLNEQEQHLLYMIVTKDVSIGINRTTIEKFIKIPKFEIQLGSRLDYDEIDWDRTFFLTKKLDGINLTVFNTKNSISMYTRQGKQVHGLTELEEEYKLLPEGVYFGEALYSHEVKNRKDLFKLTEGEINSKRKDKQISHYVFDYVTLEQWQDNNFQLTYSQELAFLQKNITNYEHIFVVTVVYQGIGRTIAMDLLNSAKKLDWEGLMLRYSSSFYEKDRSKNLIKLKPFYTVDLQIVGFKEYKKPNLLGSFIVNYKGSNVSVGSGFTLEDRKQFWENKEKLFGKIVEVQYMDETNDKSGKKSLRFPVFVRIRNDKNEVSYN